MALTFPGGAKTVVALSRYILDVAFQDHCVLCGDPVSRFGRAPYPVCPECRETLVATVGIRCERCGKPLISEIGTCLRCRRGEYDFSSVVSLFAYGGPIKRLLVSYKHHGRTSLARFFAPRIADALRERFPGLPVVPVPARPERLKAEGWDQIGLLADALERDHGAIVLRVLDRSRGRSQKELDYGARQTNLAGKIGVRYLRNSGRRVDLGHWPSVVLLDDVMTTGATLSECAKVLRREGTAIVHAIVIASD